MKILSIPRLQNFLYSYAFSYKMQAYLEFFFNFLFSLKTIIIFRLNLGALFFLGSSMNPNDFGIFKCQSSASFKCRNLCQYTHKNYYFLAYLRHKISPRYIKIVIAFLLIPSSQNFLIFYRNSLFLTPNFQHLVSQGVHR